MLLRALSRADRMRSQAALSRLRRRKSSTNSLLAASPLLHRPALLFSLAIHRAMSAPAAAVHVAPAASADADGVPNAHRLDLSAEEWFDLLDSDGRHTGKRKLRREVHRDGDWHASVHIWIINSVTGKILLQKRAACKDSFPSCWDVSCAGHLSAGETAQAAALAELGEELGISKPDEVKFEDFFRELPTMAREVISQQGKFIDREHTFIYVVEGDWALSSLKLQEEEVEAVEWMEIEELIGHLEKKTPGFVAIPDLAAYRSAVFEPLMTRAKAIKLKTK